MLLYNVSHGSMVHIVNEVAGRSRVRELPCTVCTKKYIKIINT